MGICSECGLRTASQDCECLQRQLRQAQEEYERDTRALQSVWDDFHIVEQKRDEAIRRAEAAEALAEIRLQRGLAALDILRAVLEAGRTTVAIGGLEWKGWGTARVLTPAEALAQRGEGDA